MCSHSRALERIGESTLKTISVQLALWLRQASKSSFTAPSSGISIFGGSGKKQVGKSIKPFCDSTLCVGLPLCDGCVVSSANSSERN